MSREFTPLTIDDLLVNHAVYDFYTLTGDPNGWEIENPGQDQRNNFDRLIRIAELSGKSIEGASCLDIGCGTGDFYQYWKEKKGGDYTGIDIYNQSLKKAETAYPQGNFQLRDLFANPPGPNEKYDFVFLSGSLSLNLPSRDNYEFMRGMITYAARMARYGVAFNILTDKDPDTAPAVFFYNPERTYALCQKAAPGFEIRTLRSRKHQREVFLTKPFLKL